MSARLGSGRAFPAALTLALVGVQPACENESVGEEIRRNLELTRHLEAPHLRAADEPAGTHASSAAFERSTRERWAKASAQALDAGERGSNTIELLSDASEDSRALPLASDALLMVTRTPYFRINREGDVELSGFDDARLYCTSPSSRPGAKIELEALDQHHQLEWRAEDLLASPDPLARRVLLRRANDRNRYRVFRFDPERPCEPVREGEVREPRWPADEGCQWETRMSPSEHGVAFGQRGVRCGQTGQLSVVPVARECCDAEPESLAAAQSFGFGRPIWLDDQHIVAPLVYVLGSWSDREEAREREGMQRRRGLFATRGVGIGLVSRARPGRVLVVHVEDLPGAQWITQVIVGPRDGARVGLYVVARGEVDRHHEGAEDPRKWWIYAVTIEPEALSRAPRGEADTRLSTATDTRLEPVRSLESLPIYEGSAPRGPVASRDGRTLVFSAVDSQGDGEIELVSFAGDRRVALTDNDVEDHSPGFMHDGAVVFSTQCAAAPEAREVSVVRRVRAPASP